MLTIRIFCAGGMSTSVLVNKMKKAAEARGIEVDIEASPENSMEKKLEGVDVVLLGPQIGFVLPKAEELCGARGIPVEVVPMADYGMMNGEKVLDQALRMANKM